MSFFYILRLVTAFNSSKCHSLRCLQSDSNILNVQNENAFIKYFSTDRPKSDLETKFASIKKVVANPYMLFFKEKYPQFKKENPG